MAEDHYGRIIKDGVPQCNAMDGRMDGEREGEEIINGAAATLEKRERDTRQENGMRNRGRSNMMRR